MQPVQGLGDAGPLVEFAGTEILHERHHLRRQGGGGLRNAPLHDAQLLVEVGKVDPVVQAAPLEGVVHLARAIGGDDDRRRLARLEGADLRNRDLKVGERFQQKRLELLVRAVQLIDQQHPAARHRRVDRLQQRAGQQELTGKDVDMLEAAGARLAGRLQHADAQDLPRVVPFIDRRRHVQPLVALQADQIGIQDRRQHLGDLGLADPGLSLQEQRPVELHGQEHTGGQVAVGHVGAPLHRLLHGFDAVEPRRPPSSRRVSSRHVRHRRHERDRARRAARGGHRRERAARGTRPTRRCRPAGPRRSGSRRPPVR